MQQPQPNLLRLRRFGFLGELRKLLVVVTAVGSVYYSSSRIRKVFLGLDLPSYIVAFWVAIAWLENRICLGVGLGDVLSNILSYLIDTCRTFTGNIVENIQLSPSAVTIMLAAVFMHYWTLKRDCFHYGEDVAKWVLIPGLMWTGFRFYQAGVIALCGTFSHVFSWMWHSWNESVLMLQIIISVITVTNIVLTTFLVQSRRAVTELARVNGELEHLVIEQTATLERNKVRSLGENTQPQQLEAETIPFMASMLPDTTHLQSIQAKLLHIEKMSSLGRLVAGVAHEINNPLNFVSANLEHVKEYTQHLLRVINCYQQHYPPSNPQIADLITDTDLEFICEDLPKILASMEVGTNRIRDIAQNVRDFSRLEQPQMQPVNLHAGLDSTLLILQHRFKSRSEYPGIEIHKEYDDLPAVECSPGQINQVFMNIISNAVDALDEHNQQRSKAEIQLSPSRITIRTHLKDSQRVVISIKDNAGGISEAVQAQLFDCFFTTKPPGVGTGLGLAISYQIVVEQHGGKLKCISTPGEGAEFMIELPVTQMVREVAQAS